MAERCPTPTHRSLKPVEVYDCGCKVLYNKVIYEEWEGDLPETPVTVPEVIACAKHVNGGSIPPKGARLVAVLHENEGFLSE